MGLPVVETDLPSGGAVDQMVMVAAEEHAVADVGAAAVAVEPRDVVCLGPGGGGGAAGPRAAAVAGDEGPSLGTREEAHLPAEVEGLTVGPGDQQP